MRKLLTRFAVVTAMGACALSATAVPAEAAVVIGGIDISRQCRAQYGSSYYAIALDPGNAYSWRCTYSGYQYGVNLSAGCGNQYGGGAFAVLLNPGDAYSWRCAR
jgi:hypothetical protein